MGMSPSQAQYCSVKGSSLGHWLTLLTKAWLREAKLVKWNGHGSISCFMKWAQLVLVHSGGQLWSCVGPVPGIIWCHVTVCHVWQPLNTALFMLIFRSVSCYFCTFNAFLLIIRIYSSFIQNFSDKN